MRCSRTRSLAAIFSEARYVREMVAVEAALATVEARLGVIPAESGKVIVERIGELPARSRPRSGRGMADDGVPVIELVRQLREHVGGAAADDVHFGATTQDIMDTALVLRMRAALAAVEQTLGRAIDNLAAMARRYRTSGDAGTDALPAGRADPVRAQGGGLARAPPPPPGAAPRDPAAGAGRAARRGRRHRSEPLGDRGVEVAEALAAELGLSAPPMPWHTQRDALAEVAGWLSLVSGSLAKMAQDVILLAQTEVGEVRETAEEGHGGSSTMPQKVNPVVSEQIIAAARTNAALLGAMHQALIQEHERATSGWQMERWTLPRMFELTALGAPQGEHLSAHLARRRGAHAAQRRRLERPDARRDGQLRAREDDEPQGGQGAGRRRLPDGPDGEPPPGRRGARPDGRAARLGGAEGRGRPLLAPRKAFIDRVLAEARATARSTTP